MLTHKVDIPKLLTINFDKISLVTVKLSFLGR